ncbi:MAG: hypothetical protein Q6J33_04305 [Gloeomargarita sp. DG_2_bins_126]
MNQRLGKRVSRSITFYPTPEDNDLLELLDRQAETRQLTFSELCKMALRQFAYAESTSPYILTDRELQQQVEAELVAQGISFQDWVKQKLHAPPPAAPQHLEHLEQRLQRLEAIILELQQRPIPLTRPEIEQMIQQHHSPGEPTPPLPAPPPPATDSLIAELGALLLDDF